MAAQIAKAEMLIRRPVAEVFNAFVDPGVITRFWLDGAAGPLGPGARVKWTFMVPGVEDVVAVTAFEQNARIAFDWSDGGHVEIKFERWGDAAARIAVEASGFKGESAIDEIVATTEGFTIVLCDLKTLLELGRSANLVRDKAQLITASMKKS